MVLHQPTNYDLSEWVSACCVYDVYGSVQTMLFIYIATAATFYCFRRCCHFFSPKDKYFILFFFKSQISEIMQHVLPNTEQVWRGQKQVSDGEMV